MPTSVVDASSARTNFILGTCNPRVGLLDLRASASQNCLNFGQVCFPIILIDFISLRY